MIPAQCVKDPCSAYHKQERLTLCDILEGDSLHDALLHGHLLSSRGAVINRGAGLLRVQVLQSCHSEGGQHKPEEPQVGHTDPDPVPATSALHI